MAVSPRERIFSDDSDERQISVLSGRYNQVARAAASLERCAVCNQIDAEEGASALPFNLDDCQHFVDFISLMTEQRCKWRSASSSGVTHPDES
jgi:hypothetical protein